MAFFTLASPFETHPPQVKGSVVLFRDKRGNLIVCEPESTTPHSYTKANASIIPSISKEIKTIDTTINTAALQQYTIFEGTDGNKYLSPNTNWCQEPEPPHIQLIEPSRALAETIIEDEDDDDTPPYKLDHMYARKPVKPGEETKRPIRRRSSKNSVKNEIFIQEPVEEPGETPTPTVIGPSATQSVGVSPYRSIISRPRILNVRITSNSTKPVYALPTPYVNDNSVPMLRQKSTPTFIASSTLNCFQESGMLGRTGNDMGSRTYNNHKNSYSHTNYQNGNDSNTNSVEDIHSSSRSGSTEDGTLVTESQGDSIICYISNEEVHEIVA